MRSSGPSASSRTDHAGMVLGAHELGQQHHRLAGGDQGQADHAVVRPVADVGLEAAHLAAGALHHLLPAGAGIAGGPRLAGQVGQARGPLATAGRRMAGGQDQVHGVAVQVDAVDAGGPGPGLVLPLVAQDQVHVAQLQRRQGVLGLGLAQLTAQPRVLAGQRADGRDGHLQRHRLERGDPRPAADLAGGGRQLGLGQLGAVQQRLGVAHQHDRRVGQPDAAARGLEQRHARLALQHRQLLRDRRRGELQRVGHRGHRAPLVQLAQQPESPEVEHHKQR